MSSESPVTPTSRKYHAIGKYEILSHVATGGMGTVYRAVNTESGQEVALKVLSPALATKGGTALERFRREGRIQLQHENIVAIYEIGEANSIHYLALEYVDGIDLHEYSNQKGPLPPDEARRLLVQAARALDYLHRHQMVHRDVKPSNFLLSYRGDEPVLKLTDMGLARDVTDNDGRVTRAGNTVGTIDYMAPEQARDSGVADIRSDIYALGCSFYHMLAGQPPFPEGGLAEKLYKHAEAEPPDIRRYNPQVPAAVVMLLHRMLAKRPEDRYQTPAELLEDLGRLDRGEQPLARSLGAKSDSGIVARVPQTAASTPATTGTGSADDGAPQLHSVTLQNRLAAAKELERAQHEIACGNGNAAMALLRNCCTLDPTNVSYRQALRQVQKTEYEKNSNGNRLAWLPILVAKIAVKVARLAGAHLKVLDYGEMVLSRRSDIGVKIDMAAAAEELGLSHVALWILEQSWSKDSQTPALNRALAELYEKRGLYIEAAKLWKLVLREEPGDLNAHRKVNDLAAKETIERGSYKQMVVSRTGRELG
jgi:serine/threonine-protein kinase